MTDRIRFALLFLVLAAFVVARAGGAFGAHARQHARHHLRHASRRVSRHPARHYLHHVRVSRATLLAREQTRIVDYARRLLGVPYVYGGSSPRYGFDCSGFTRFVYAHFGVALPHYSVAQFDLGHRVSRWGLRPGDLVFFDGLGHVGLYIGHNRFIHAPHTGTDVQVSSLNGWYASEYDGARRIL